MEQKGAFTVTLLTGAILLSFLVCSVSCRPRGSSNSSEPTSNYAKGQRYDSHHHHSTHRLSPGSNSNSHHHHHYANNNNNNHPHHHNKHVHFHHDKQQQQQRPSHHQVDEVLPEIEESNKISPLHDTPEQRRIYPSSTSSLAAPLVATSKSARATKSTRNNYPSGSRRLREDDYEEDYEDDDEEDGATQGRHAYLMTSNKKKSSKERLTEDEALSQAFEKHMRPSSSIKESPTEEVHDVYAYQLPSDLWFVVRYNRNEDGQVEKYMNIVDSFTNYLDKLDKDVKTVSVNVKGVETVFRLTTKHNNSSSSSSSNS